MTKRIEAYDQSGTSPPGGMEIHPSQLFPAATYYIPDSAKSHVELPARTEQVQSLPDHLMTVREAAIYAHVHEETIRRAYHAGQLSVLRIGRAIRVRPGDLQDWLEREGKTRAA